jgi:P2-related tail formation protein
VPIHRSKGTNAAIRLVLKSLGIEAELREWFEYHGRPNHLQLVSNSTMPLSDKATKFFAMLDIYKRKAAHLDKIVVRLSAPANVYSGVHLINSTKYTYAGTK